MEELAIKHSKAFRIRRFLNWFPMGLTYAFLYMGRYNLTVAKTSLGDRMTKEEFGFIFGVGTIVYACAFLFNGPLTDKIGGKKAILIGAFGTALMNLIMGILIHAFTQGTWTGNITPLMAVLYGFNMYFQSYGAVAIVKVNSYWFHVRERGGFSGIFGTMITSGIFFAFTVNDWILDKTKELSATGEGAPWVVFFVPSGILFTMFLIELFLLKDRPSLAGFEDFDTGDASSGEENIDIPLLTIMKRVITNPIILTIALIEFCTGIIRNGVMHWFKIYTEEVWSLPPDHILMHGKWGNWHINIPIFLIAASLFILSTKLKGKLKGYGVITGAILALTPFIQGGWGGLLFIAGVAGGNIAGWVSDLFFQSRRAPVAAILYFIIILCVIGIYFSLGDTKTVVDWINSERIPELKKGDRIIKVNGKDVKNWYEITKTIACIPSICEGEGVKWDVERCFCTSKPKKTEANLNYSDGFIYLTIERIEGNKKLIKEIKLKDPYAKARAGEIRKIQAGPELTISPFWLGLIMFLISLSVIGTHGVMSGTATMDFGGRKGAATATGMIDGFVYLGTAFQSFALGYITTKNWYNWPTFLLPFSIIGFLLLLKIWNAKPKASRSGSH